MFVPMVCNANWLSKRFTKKHKLQGHGGTSVKVRDSSI